jgi:hypothetical protein
MEPNSKGVSGISAVPSSNLVTFSAENQCRNFAALVAGSTAFRGGSFATPTTDPRWTKAQLALLGKEPDAVIAGPCHEPIRLPVAVHRDLPE